MHGTYIAGMLGIPTVSIGLHPKLKFASNYFDNSITVSDAPSLAEITKAVSAVSADASEQLDNLTFAQIRGDVDNAMQTLNTWIAKDLSSDQS